MSDATQRLDTTPDADTATQRLPEAMAVGEEATLRLDAATQRLNQTAPASPASPPPSGQGEYFAAGQTVNFNGIDTLIQRELNAQSGEAVTYVVEQGGQTRVLKHYRPGLRIPAELLGRIRDQPHGDVIHVHDFGSRQGQDFEIMEYANGGTLADFLREHGAIRDIPRLQHIVAEIVAGLEHLHGPIGAIYQDLKPDNILFRDASRTDIVLADFGISSLIQPGSREATVKAHGTREYSAPELARFGNQTDAQVDAGVDYFALGITLLECWTGQRPFQGIPDAVRMAQIRDKEVAFPADMDPQLATLIKGLINPLPRERWGQAQVHLWLEGKPLAVEYVATRRPYERRSFNEQETFASPAELADLLQRYPDKGKDYLYLGRIKEWLDKANDMDLSTEIEKIMGQFNKDARHRDAGLLLATYTLAPERPFVSVGGRACTTSQQAGAAFLAEQTHYRQALANPLEPFYLYLQATGGAQEAASLLSLFSTGRSSDFAFNMAVYQLQGEGEDCLKLNGGDYYLPEDVNTRADADTRALIRAQILQADSTVLIWLQRLGYIARHQGYNQADSADAFAMLKAFPWLDLRDLAADWAQRQAAWAIDLMRQQRLDLLEVFHARGLAFDSCTSAGTTPLQVAAGNNQVDLIDYLLDHGASVDFPDARGATALFTAVAARHEGASRRLLERGAAPDHADQSGQTPLAMACSVQYQGNQRLAPAAPLVSALLEKGAKANRNGADGKLPLHLALWHAASGNDALQLLEVFLRHKADLRRAGSDVSASRLPAYPALFAALLAYEQQQKRSPESLAVIERLIAAGARLDARCDGRTALHFAAGWGAEALCDSLLAQGANRRQASQDGHLAANYARYKQVPALAEKLDPGFAFSARRLLLRTGTLLLKGMVLLTLFYSLGNLAGLFQSLDLSHPLYWIAGYVLAHATAAGFLLAWEGSWQNFRDKLRGTVGYARGAVAWLLLMPLVLPFLLGGFDLALSYTGHLLPAVAPVLDLARLLPATVASLGQGPAAAFATLAMLAVLLTLQLRASAPSLQAEQVWALYRKAKLIK